MSSVLYVGTNDGVATFVQSSPASEWTRVDGNIPTRSVTELAFDPEHPNRIYAATDGDGVWVSENFGESWKKPNYARRGPGKVRCLTMDPHNADRLFAGCEPIDMYVSENCGQSWELVTSLWENPYVPTIDFGGSPTAEPHIRDIAIDPQNPDVMYLALQVASILKTIDGGKSWQHIEKEIDRDVHTFAIDPRDSDHVVIATGGHDARGGRTNGKALYSTHDGGESWNPLAMDFEQQYSLPLVEKPTDPNVLYSSLADSTPGVWRRRESGAQGIMIKSTDSGETWNEVDISNIPNFSLSMVTAISMDDRDPTRVVAGFNTGAIIASDDDGGTWRPISPKVSSISDIKYATY